ncbi:unnamed protein product [Dovyalis caffra]|uniref:Uncharacterized protein n=1 Tax=Dovyalis caffra TaxID=77055 RepID=A0AAV1RDV2_9ROSI|nr:unnamed protein product [Dovyalis caffra]
MSGSKTVEFSRGKLETQTSVENSFERIHGYDYVAAFCFVGFSPNNFRCTIHRGGQETIMAALSLLFIGSLMSGLEAVAGSNSVNASSGTSRDPGVISHAGIKEAGNAISETSTSARVNNHVRREVVKATSETSRSPRVINQLGRDAVNAKTEARGSPRVINLVGREAVNATVETRQSPGTKNHVGREAVNYTSETSRDPRVVNPQRLVDLQIAARIRVNNHVGTEAVNSTSETSGNQWVINQVGREAVNPSSETSRDPRVVDLQNAARAQDSRSTIRSEINQIETIDPITSKREIIYRK